MDNWGRVPHYSVAQKKHVLIIAVWVCVTMCVSRYTAPLHNELHHASSLVQYKCCGRVYNDALLCKTAHLLPNLILMVHHIVLLIQIHSLSTYPIQLLVCDTNLLTPLVGHERLWFNPSHVSRCNIKEVEFLQNIHWGLTYTSQVYPQGSSHFL